MPLSYLMRRDRHCRAGSLLLLDEPLIGIPREEGTEGRGYEHIWHPRRNHPPQFVQQGHPARRRPPGWVLVSAFIYHGKLGNTEPEKRAGFAGPKRASGNGSSRQRGLEG